ncbi:MAG: hypothetical protein ACOVMM_10175 [Chitinophagaceae bacterium]
MKVLLSMLNNIIQPSFKNINSFIFGLLFFAIACNTSNANPNNLTANQKNWKNDFNKMLPYTSVFMQLDYAYWNEEKEPTLRIKIKN